MIDLDAKERVEAEVDLTPLDLYGAPTEMPDLPKGHVLIGGYDPGLGETLFVCETLDDMIELHGRSKRTIGSSVNWYSAPPRDGGYKALILGMQPVMEEP